MGCTTTAAVCQPILEVWFNLWCQPILELWCKLWWHMPLWQPDYDQYDSDVHPWLIRCCKSLAVSTFRLRPMLLLGVGETKSGRNTALPCWPVYVTAAAVQGRQGIQQGCQGGVGERRSEVGVCCARRGRGLAGMSDSATSAPPSMPQGAWENHIRACNFKHCALQCLAS